MPNRELVFIGKGTTHHDDFSKGMDGSAAVADNDATRVIKAEKDTGKKGWREKNKR